MLNIDLTQVKEQSFGVLPGGQYTVSVFEAQIKETKTPGGEYIHLKFRIVDGEHAGKFLFSMFNIKNQNPKAVEIGLSQLKTFMKSCGKDATRLTNVLDLVGYTCDAVVKKRIDSQCGEQAVISYFKPIESVSKKDNSDVPF